MAQISQGMLHTALLLAVAKLKPDDVGVLDYVDMLAQPNCLDAQMGQIAQTARSLATAPLTKEVCRTLQTGGAPDRLLRDMNATRDRRTLRKEAEMEVQIADLREKLEEAKEKLCQSQMEVKALHAKLKEHPGVKPSCNAPLTYLKSKAGKVAKELLTPFPDGSKHMQRQVRFLELVRRFLVSCDSQEPSSSVTDGGDERREGAIISLTAAKVLKHLSAEVHLHIDRLQALSSKDDVPKEVEQASSISGELRKCLEGLSPLALNILGLTTCDHLLPGVRDELIIIFSLFLRDILDSLCIAGSVMNDILARSQEGPSTGTKRRSPTGAAEPKEPPSQRRRLSTGSSNTTIADEVDAVTVSPENGTLEDHRTTLCQELNSIVLDFCAAQPALVPIMILAYTRHCVALAEIMRGILPGLPAVFRTDEDKSDDGRSTQPAAGSERECKLWRRVLRADDGSADCAAGNALHMSYYFLHGLDKLVDVDSARDVEGYVSENLITLCNALLEDSLIRTPPEYSSYAFTICVKLEDYVGQARFSVSRVAAQLVSRCLDAGKE